MTHAVAEYPSPELQGREGPPAALESLAPLHGRAVPLETRTNRGLAFGVGLLLAVLTVQTEYVGTPTDFVSRVAPVDFLCVALLALLFFRHSLKLPPRPAFLYLAAILVSLIPGLLFTSGPERDVWVGASALLMALGYYVLGINLGASRTLIHWLLAGLCVGVFGQAIIVVHDVVSPTQWFPDPMEGRVRGTFKANGQLGAYGFCAAGLLVTFGSTLGSPAFRKACVALAITAASFVFLASRRTGMISVFAWGALFCVLAHRFSKRVFFKIFVGGYLAVMLAVGAFWPQIEASFIGRRFMDAVSSMGKDEGFIQNQFKSCLETAGQWFPLGFGVGRGSHINLRDGHEIHNCILAVLVELGVLGLLGYLGTVLLPLLKRQWRQRSADHELLGVILTSFLLISLVFMCHNTLDRDRTFLLYLGIATMVVAQESRLWMPSQYFPSAGQGNLESCRIPAGE